MRSVYGRATFNKIGHWAIRLTASETEKQSSMICLAQAVLSQLLISKCCSVMMPSYARRGAARPDSWTPVFHSAKEVLSRIYKRVCGMGSLKARSRIQNLEDVFRVFSTFWSWGKDLIQNYCSKWNLSLLFWSGYKRTGHEMAPSSMSIEEKIQSIRRPARSWSLSVCLVDCEGLFLVDAVRGERINSGTYVRTLTKTRERFKSDRPTRIQQISCFCVTTQGLTQD